MVACEVQDALGKDKVILPEMVEETNQLLERGLEAFTPGEPRDLLAVEAHLMPKNNSILQVVNSNVAESLDMMMAQPLLAVETPAAIPPCGTLAISWPGKSEKPIPMQEGSFGPSFEEFPPLEKGRTRRIRENFEHRRESSRSGGPRTAVSSTFPSITNSAEPRETNTKPKDHNKDVGMSEIPGDAHMPDVGINPPNPATPDHAIVGDTQQPRKTKSMADVVREKSSGDGPQVFLPENIQSMGFASSSNGIPSIYFSSSETQKLATSLGHAIVGKFSHSIPNSTQIQKALDNIKFCRGFSWTYINAKHVLVQFEDISDYARLLSGPKGALVWYIDRHPMRVFKWSPEFDAYCESPIAAIWCNLIGLPIHLYDQSALFAIGKLLGTPIQVDRATATRSRLSFARLCIEIDISKPPPEEIILDICGRATIQQVKWDKIPSYCKECKHVGHKSEVCYASGKTERPPKRNYNNYIPKQAPQGGQDGKEPQEKSNQTSSSNVWKQQGKAKGANYGPMNKGAEAKEWSGPDIMGDLQNAKAMVPYIQAEDETIHVYEGGSQREGEASGARSSNVDPGDFSAGYLGSQRGAFTSWRGGSRGTAHHPSGRGRGGHRTSHLLSSNQYFSLMENEDFENYDEVDGATGEMDMDMLHNPDGRGKNPAIKETDMSREKATHHNSDCQGDPSRSLGTIFPL